MVPGGIRMGMGLFTPLVIKPSISFGGLVGPLDFKFFVLM